MYFARGVWLFPLSAALACVAGAQNVYLSEFLASNDSILADEDGEFSDWVELYNDESTPVSLDGWYLTDSASNLRKWRIPAVTIAGKGFMIVFCSDKNRAVPGSPLHTNFKLSASGEYLALIRPDGVTRATEYAPTFPPQIANMSYGLGWTGSTTTLVTENNPARVLVPLDASLGTSWRATSFNDSAWTSGLQPVGYETASGYENIIRLSVRTAMYNVTGSAYIRLPFTLTSVPTANTMTLRMKYDDGFVAYLNGVEIARANAPAVPAFDSVASAGHDDALAVIFQEFDASTRLNLLTTGTNVLAIHGLNLARNNQDFLVGCTLDASVSGSINPADKRYFTGVTPNGPNGRSSADSGPRISSVVHTPAQPTDAQDLVVTARVAVNAAPIQAVSLKYRVNYGSEVTLAMADDGLHGDGAAGDGVYGAIIPASASTPGQMIRYFVSATDTQTRASREPAFTAPTNSPEYLGTVVSAPAVSSQLPIFWWFVQSPSAAATDNGTRASIYYLGRFYDNVLVRLRGQTSASWPKPHYKFDMNSGLYFTYKEDAPPVEEFNLQSTYSDKSYIRQTLSWETYRDCGAVYSDSFPMRVQQNGAFHSVGIFVEQPDGTYLARNGRDSDGALYKMYNECTDAVNSVEKKTRSNEDNSDLAALVAGVQLSGDALANYLYDNVDIPATITHLAATVLIHDNDDVGKNYYLYRDSEGSGEWTMMPWDKDLTFGRNYGAGGGVLSDGIWADDDPFSHPLFGDRDHPKIDGPWNRLTDALYRVPSIRQMFLRRLRSVMDLRLQPAATPYAQRYYEHRIDQLVSAMSADVALDRAAWGNPYGQDQSFATAISILKNEYLSPRRTHLFQTHAAPNGIIPAAQAASADSSIGFGDLDRSPVSGNSEEEFLQLVNSGSQAVDISGWQLDGDISHTFRPGTVIPAFSSMYVVANTNAFRARVAAPHGGMGLFIQGNYNGHLSQPCEPLSLLNASGALVARFCRCAADYNEDGGVDGSDVESFFIDWESAQPLADVNEDGGIDGSDVESFFLVWAAGGC